MTKKVDFFILFFMNLVILGSGTSHGVPVIGCTCKTCTSCDPKDNRLRASALVLGDNKEAILIDAGPEFRLQALREHIDHLNAVLITHAHADHIHGLDDIRIFSKDKDMELWANKQTIKDIKERFAYIFKKTQLGGGKPHLNLCTVKKGHSSINIGSINIIPIPLNHGDLPILGWRINDTAYLTDCNNIPKASYQLLKGTKKLVIDALRLRPHSTHFNFTQALEVINKTGADQAWFTHICHDFTHQNLQSWLKTQVPDKKIEPAYDGLRIKIE